jgi:drug/metabolite transporter (DMT)-like permease
MKPASSPPHLSRVIAVWWIACLLWSGTFLFIKLGLADVPPWTFASVRLVIALAILTPMTWLRGGFDGLTRSDAVRIMIAGVLLLGVNYGLLYWGARAIPSGLVAILQSATPVLALGIGWAFGSERVTLRKIAALAAGVIGVTVIFRAEIHASGMSALADAAAVLGSSACVAFAYAWLKGHARRLPPFTVTTLQCVAGLVPLAIVALSVEGNPLAAHWSSRSIAAVLYLAIGGSVFAFWLNYWLLARMDASAMLMMGVAEVPIAVALGAMIFGERLPSGTLTGALCVLAAVVLGPVAAGRDNRAHADVETKEMAEIRSRSHTDVRRTPSN